MLTNKKIIIGLSGGIAAYKSIYLIRMFIKVGAEVKVVATKNALQFITQITLESVSKNKLYFDVFGKDNDYSTEHISLTDWADIMVIAPASANIIGKFANGIADDALSTTFLAFNKDIFICPAMNCKMWDNFSVQKNVKFLLDHGINFIGPSTGDLACGYEGIGRMEEPENIFKKINDYYYNSAKLKGKKALVTAGPTFEAIDPVRFIGNHSSGLMGFCIAEELANNGADVVLVSGPSNLNLNNKTVTRINVTSSDEMYNECIKHFATSDITVMSAAVADYKPEYSEKNKIKKDKKAFSINLVPTKDILSELGKIKDKKQILVGFALETDSEIENAKKKLYNKNLDFIVLNSLNDKGAGFKHDTNKITIIDKNNDIQIFDLKSKKEAAYDIVQKILSFDNII